MRDAGCGSGVGIGSRFGSVPPLDREDLFDNFIGLEIAFPAVESARAEFAAISAAHLR